MNSKKHRFVIDMLNEIQGLHRCVRQFTQENVKIVKRVEKIAELTPELEESIEKLVNGLEIIETESYLKKLTEMESALRLVLKKMLNQK